MKKPWIKLAAVALVVSAIGALAAKGMSSLKKSRYAEIEQGDLELEEESFGEEPLEEELYEEAPFEEAGEVPVEPEDLVF